MLALVGVAAALVALLAARQLAWFLSPILLALVIVVLVHPLHGWLRRRVPAAIALLGLVVGCYAVILVIAGVLVVSLAQLATLLPSYLAAADELLGSLATTLQQLGIGREQVRAALSDVDPGRVVAAVTAALRSVGSFGASLVFLFSLLLFLGIDAAEAGQRYDTLRASRPALAQALADFSRNTRRFLAVATVFGLITGLADTILLWVLGIPLAVLWGLLAAICNYIPYVGFVIGLVPPALLALLDGGWRRMLLVIIVYIVLNTVFTSIIQPYFVGDAVGVSVSVTFLGLLLWGWVLGPLGAVLAVPTTLLIKAILIDSDPRADWARALVGSTPPSPTAPVATHAPHPSAGSTSQVAPSTATPNPRTEDVA
jgi:AI-2 transport protein TqsA